MRRTAQTLRRVSAAAKRIVAYRYEYKCAEPTCRVMLPPTWECDHIIPLWKIARDSSIWAKDPNHLDNLQPLCPNCHSQKTLAELLERERLKLGLPTIPPSHTPYKPQTKKPQTKKPNYFTCHLCNVRYSPYFDHKCAQSEFFDTFAFDSDV